MSVLVACPTYRGKEYALQNYLDAYRNFTYPDRDLFLVDNTPGTIGYARRLRSLGIETAHVEPMPDFWDMMEQCWRVIVERAHDRGFDYIASIEADVICPPNTIEVLLSADDGRGLVELGVPQHDRWRFDMWTLSCVLVRTDILYESRFLWETSIEVLIELADPVKIPGLPGTEHLEDDGEPGWSGAGEGKVFGSGRG